MSRTPIHALGREAVAKKGWWAAHKWLLLRRASQVSILALFILSPWAARRFDMVPVLEGNLSSSLAFGTVPMTDPLLFLQILAAGFWSVAGTAALGAMLVLAFYLVVGGRVYCAWVCPVNIVTDAAHWLRRRLGLKGAAHISRATRLWMLGAVLALALGTGSLAWELVNPVSLLHRGLIFGMGAGWAVILAVFLFDLLVMRHGWCGHICPVGAFYGLVGEAALIRVRADRRKACDDCMECYEVCPEPQIIPPALKGRTRKGEAAEASARPAPPVILAGACTNCGRCIDICAENVFAFGLRFVPGREGAPTLPHAAGRGGEGHGTRPSPPAGAEGVSARGPHRPGAAAT